jgi:hypothetical protein
MWNTVRYDSPCMLKVYPKSCTLHFTNEGKVVFMLNEELQHEDIWGSGSKAPHILNLGTGLR